MELRAQRIVHARRPLIAAALAAATSTLLAAPAPVGLQQRSATPPARRIAANATCASDLGSGVTSRRRYCDVMIAKSGADSVALAIPPHTGPATLLFDLHNRFTVPAANAAPGEGFMRATALLAVVRPTGQIIERVAVRREYHTAKDLFDRISGGPPAGGVKAVAPGQAEAIRVIVPTGVTGIGIVGLRLEYATVAQPKGVADTPGRPIAIVSNVRVEYLPGK